MAGERPTQSNLPDQAQEKARQELLGKFLLLANALLEPSVQHTSSWRRAIYVIPKDLTQKFYDDLMQSGLSDLVRGHQNPETGEEYPTETPAGAYIVAEEFDHTNHTLGTPGSKRAELEVVLRYDAECGEFNDLRIGITAGKPQATSYVYSSERAETGYEGNSWGTKKLDLHQLLDFYGLLANNATTRLPEEPMEKQMAEIKIVNKQTGQELFYDKNTGDWKPREGEEIQAGNDEELNANNPYADKLRVKASYRLEKVEGEETPKQ